MAHSPLHLALGMFDGVHVGHQAVIRQAVDAAAAEPGHCSGVLTFDPHPSRILYPERATRLIMPVGQRIRKMHALGAGCVFVQPFTAAYGRQDAAGFVAALQRRFAGLRSLHVGENFRYGAGRSGDVTTLAASAAAAGVRLQVLPSRILGGVAVSSSRIREALQAGDMAAAGAMLGHPYLVEGRVTAGNSIGRRIGFPTLNIPWNPEVLPRFGVYRVVLQRAGSARVTDGIANYGVRPTVGAATEPLLEVHLFDAAGLPAAGEEVRVGLVEFLRPEQAFASVEALRDQIAADVAAVRRQVAAAPVSVPEGFF